MPHEVEISSMDPSRFGSVLAPEQVEAFEQGVEEARRLLDGRVVWNINSTAHGGGVVELLRPLISYARGAGVDARWIVIDGTPEFFTITKRIHNRLHGAVGDGGPLDDDARRLYERVLDENVKQLEGRVREGDVVIVHDPQPAGMIESFRAAGARVIWRCHIGTRGAERPRAGSLGLPPSRTWRRPRSTCSRARLSCGRVWTATARW